MIRVPVTGNGTFDAVEIAAYAAYLTAVNLNGLNGTEVAEKQAEIAYLHACWISAMTQLGPSPVQGFNGVLFVGHNVPVPLSPLAKNLATQLRARGINLPTYYVIISGGPKSGNAGASYAVGDTFNIATGLIKAVGQVLTVSSGAVVTFAMVNMGLYSASPSVTAAATSGTSGGGDNNLQCTLVVYPLTPLYNF